MKPLVRMLAAAAMLLAAACQPAGPAASSFSPVGTAAGAAVLPSQAPAIPTLSPRAAAPTAALPAATPTLPPQPADPAASPEAAATLQSSQPPVQSAPCTEDHCSYAGLLFLQKPIHAPGNDQLDVSYRFGSTQGGTREAHHGVEFPNAYGTPVFAAGDGKVIAAGPDMDPTSPPGVWPLTYLGPYGNFYGNLVVIEHQIPAISPEPPEGAPQPLYTLYGHLSEVDVQVGQQVRAGDTIGKVGQAGIATGPHLHFEVREGENSYKASRNPELWLAEQPAGDGQPGGAIAARFLDSFGNYLEMPSIVIEYLPDGPNGAAGKQITLRTYEESILSGQLPWRESFAVGGLPAGLYRLNFPMGGLRQELVQVLAGQVTALTFHGQ